MVAGAIGRWDPDPEQGTFRGWLFRIARNLSLNVLASRKRQAIGSGDTGIAQLLDQQPAADPEDTAWFDEEYRRSVFRWATARIRGEFQESTWQAFWRTAVEGQSPRQVAEDLGLTVGAVYVYRNRIVARLRKVVEQAEG